jgi:hypothetical protein
VAVSSFDSESNRKQHGTDMTDYPRFRAINGRGDDCHRHYHGAPVVDLVFGLLDWWLEHRNGAITIRFRSLNVKDRAQQDVAHG